MKTSDEYREVALRMLAPRRVELHHGLSDAEILTAEQAFGFRFPPDLAAFLKGVLPVSDDFPNWRTLGPAVDARLQWPVESVLFDVEHSDFWWDEWGDHPLDRAARLARARVALDVLPQLIPVFGHRYLPSDPCSVGNPVLSIYQTDVVVYGADLDNWLQNEFGTSRFPDPRFVRQIPFWSALTLDSPMT